MLVLNGIPNCDTVKKARKWLDAQGVEYRFRDFRKVPPTLGEVRRWLEAVGEQTLLNRRGLTWRRLPAERREALTPETIPALLVEEPTLIKRPVLEFEDGRIEVGFSEDRYAELFG